MTDFTTKPFLPYSLTKYVVICGLISGFSLLTSCSSPNSSLNQSSPSLSAENASFKISSEGKQALENIQKLNMRLDIGDINLDEYSKVVIDIKFSVDKFQQSSDAKKSSEFSENLQSAIDGHLLALEFWKNCYSTTFEDNCFSNAEPLPTIFQRYPDIKAQEEELTKLEPGGLSIKIWNTKGVLSRIWKHIDEDTQKAANALK